MRYLTATLVLVAILATTAIAAEPTLIPMRVQRGFLIVFDCAVPPIEKLTCVLDTGASRTVVDARVTSRLHLRATADEVLVAGRSTQASRIQLQLAFGTMTVPSLPALVLDLGEFSKALGTRIDVIVGCDVLRIHEVTIDYRRRVLRFDDHIAAGTSVALDPDCPYPVVLVRIGEQTVRLLLDTGTDAISLFDAHVPAPLLLAPQVDAAGRSAAGAVRAKAIRAIDIQIGGNKFGRQTIFVVPGESGFTAYDGHLGIRPLELSWLHLDFVRRQISWGK